MSQGTTTGRSKNRAKLNSNHQQQGADMFGKKPGATHLTMTRDDYNAYEFICRQAEAKEWIEAVLDDSLPSTDLYESLGDGVILCKLMNLMYPSSIPAFNGPKSFAWKLRENIVLFLNALQKQGLKKEDIFAPDDLFDKKNMPLVVSSLQKLAELAASQGFKIQWKKLDNVPWSDRDIQKYKMYPGVNIWNLKSADKEEQAKREQAEKEKTELKRAQEELERKRREQEEAERLAEEIRLRELEEQRRREEQKRLQAEKEKAEYLRAQEELERQCRKKEEELALRYPKISQIRKQLLECQNGPDGNSPLHMAVLKQMSEVVDYLLNEEKADPNTRNDNGDTPLHFAAEGDNETITKMLLDKGANPEKLNRDGNTPLHRAALSGKDKQVRKLLDGGAEVNARNNQLATPLLLATQKKQGKCMDELIKSNADVNMSNKDAEYPLHVAAFQGSVPFVDKLWNSGHLNLNPRNQDNATPLQVAAEHKHTDVVKRLLELGADWKTQRNDGWSPLYTAAYFGDHETLLALLLKGADVNGTNAEGWTPLHAACAQDHIRCVQIMVDDFKAQVNVVNAQGTTPLFHATIGGKRKIVDYLVQRNADINLSSPGGWKPIHASCYMEFPKLTTFLVNNKALLSEGCSEIDNYTPLHMLLSQRENPPMDLVQLLVTNGAKLDALDASGGTPLHIAAYWGHEDATKYLIQQGNSRLLEIRNTKARTALDVAATYSHEKIARLLADAMGVPVPVMGKKSHTEKTREMKAPGAPPKPENYK